MYWIVHNNWGAWDWGDSGDCYIPIDYECIVDYYVIRNGRPLNFIWTYAKDSETEFNIHATEWNALTKRINMFRTYCGLPKTTFTVVASGVYLEAEIFNEVRDAISYMSLHFGGAYDLPPRKVTDDDIYAEDLNVLVNAMNSIP
jgi:hypothetical protein